MKKIIHAVFEKDVKRIQDYGGLTYRLMLIRQIEPEMI